MTALATNTPRNFDPDIEGLFEEMPSDATTTTYEGAAVGENASAGTVRGLVDGDTFHGFAERKCDNSAGAAGAKRVTVRRQGNVELAVAGTLATADMNAPVYATEDGTFSKTDSGSDTQIGKISRVISATKAMVFFQGATVRSI